MQNKPTIVLIHGLLMSPKSWRGWKARYEDAGYEVIAHPWPGVSDDVEGLRKNPTPLNGLRIGAVIDFYDTVVRGLDEPPIIIGHSFGGVVTQALLNRGLGRVGVAVDSAPSAGVPVLPLSLLRVGIPVFTRPWNIGRTILLTPRQFQYGFANTLPLDKATKVSDEFQIPGPERPFWQVSAALFFNVGDTKMDYNKPDRAPLLFITGGEDHIVPPKMTYKNAARYKGQGTITEVKEFPGRSHYGIIGDNGWEEVADYALSWATRFTSREP